MMRPPRKRTYNTWRSMRKRCLDQTDAQYARYGGRGITICDEWGEFNVFVRDMGYRPEGMTLDRIDNAKGYSSDNCRWATPEQQAINRCRTRFVTLNGKTQTIRHWERELGLSRGALNQRLKRGWSLTEIITASTRPSAQIKIAAKRRSSHVQ